MRLEKALVSSHRLSMVTMLLSEAVSLWPQFAIQIFGVQTVLRFGGMKGRMGSESTLQGSSETTVFA